MTARLTPHEARLRWRAFVNAAQGVDTESGAEDLRAALIAAKFAHFPVEGDAAQMLALSLKHAVHGLLAANDVRAVELAMDAVRGVARAVDGHLTDLGHRETHRSLVRAGAVR